MMWGCFIGSVQDSIIPIHGDPAAPKGGDTARSYIKVLEEGLLEFIEEMGCKKKIIFMQDNAPIHKAHIV